MNKITAFLSACAASLLYFSATALADDFVIDVRTQDEYASGHDENSLNIPFNEVVEGVSANDIKKDDTIYVYCLSGKRAGKAKNSLNNAGYTNVINLGGYEDAMVYFKNNPLK